MATVTELHLQAPVNTANDQSHTPPPLRLPKALVAHLSKPFESLEDVDRLIAHIRICEWRGLL